MDTKRPNDMLRSCNIERLVHAMKARGIDALLISQPTNVYYLTGFNATAHKADEPRPYAVVLDARAPEEPTLVVADYYLATFLQAPTWVQDIRPFRAVMMPLDLPARREDLERFIPRGTEGVEWLRHAREHYEFDMKATVVKALASRRLDHARIGCDDLAFGMRMGIEGHRLADAYDCLMQARSIKTAPELAMMAQATAVNETAIRRTIDGWHPSMTWAELTRLYGQAATDLGGFVRDPGGMVWGHPPGQDPAIMLQAGTENDPVSEGSHVMFDCHGTIRQYCWDGGKTWVAGGSPQGLARTYERATAAVAEYLLGAMKPGARVSALQSGAREAYRKAGHPEADSAVIFFHGLGLSHMDIPMARADGSANADWQLEEDMVVPMHLLCPGGASERWWLEEVVHVGPAGGRPLFSWGFGAL